MSTETITDNIHDRLAALRAYGQDLADAEQGHAECVAEARNEVALYGDSGPGSALRNSESAAALSRMRAEMQTTQEVQTPAYRRIDETGVPAAVRFSSPQGRAEGQIVQVEYGTFGRGEGCKGDPFMRRCDTSTGCAWSYYRLDAIDDYDAWMHAGRPTTVA